MQKLKYGCVLSSIFLINSCGSKPNQTNGQFKDLSPQVIQTYHDSFERWKMNLVKSCDANEAIGISSDKSKRIGLDGGILLKKNNNSAIVKGQNGEFAILNSYSTYTGLSTSTLNQSTTTNGKTLNFNVEMKQEGSHCTVYLSGEKIYETDIIMRFNVGSYWARDKNPDTINTHIKSKTYKNNYTEVTHHGLFDAFAVGLKGNNHTYEFLGKHFGLSTDQAKKYFDIDSSSSDLRLTHSVRILNTPKSTWFNLQTPKLIGEKSLIDSVFNENQQNVELEWRLTPPFIEFGETSNDADGFTIKLLTTMNISHIPNQIDFYQSTLKNAKLEVSLLDPSEPSKCILDRAEALKSIKSDHIPKDSIYPKVTDLFSPCYALTDKKLIELDGTVQKLIPEVLENVFPNKNIQYNGWDKVISELITQYLDTDRNIQDILDPSHLSPVIENLSNYIWNLKNIFKTSQYLPEIKEYSYQLGLQWGFNGEYVPLSHMIKIIDATNNTINPFKYSTKLFLEDLSKNPDSYNETLEFAASIDEEYKLEASKILLLSKELDFLEWERNQFDFILQKKLSLSDLNNWSLQLQEIKNALSLYPNLNELKKSLAEFGIHALRRKDSNIEQIKDIYSALNHVVHDFPESTRSLIYGLSNSIPNNLVAVNFAKTVTPEYKKLVSDIRNITPGMGINDWNDEFLGSILQKQPTLEQLKIWYSTLNGALKFIQNEQVRMQNQSEFSTQNHLGSLIKRSLNDGWTEKEFSALEKITELGKFKSSCNFYKSTAAIANCLGMDLFSTKSKKFFDPNYNNRYHALASDFIQLMNTLKPEFDYYNGRNNILSSFFARTPIWGSCSNPLFQSKNTLLHTQVKELLSTKDTFKKWDIEKKIQITLKDCN